MDVCPGSLEWMGKPSEYNVGSCTYACEVEKERSSYTVSFHDVYVIVALPI